MGPLDGYRVLDFTRVLTGPHCTRMLVDMGADVIKVEAPEGDIMRYGRPRVNSMSTSYAQHNTGKRNISVDLSKPRGPELIMRLVGKVDIVVENFRPGVMERLGIGYEPMAELNPRLVYATITGYGQRGSWAGRAAYAATIHAEMGLMEMLSRHRGEPPAHDAFSHADLYAALECVSGILAALLHRERTGEGQRVDVSMAQTMLSVSEHVHAEVLGDQTAASGSALTRSSVFRMRDGRYVTVAADLTRAGAFGQLCAAMGRDDLDYDPRFATDESRDTNREALQAEVQSWVETFEDTEALEAAFQKGRLAMGVVRTLRESAAGAWALGTDAIVQVPDRGTGTIPVPGPPWAFSRTPAAVRGEPAYRGEHNREVLSELAGLSPGEIHALEAEGVLSSRLPRSEPE